MTALQVGGVEDHIHALIMAPPTLSPSQIAQLLKGESSKWIHEEFAALKHFGWQDGYAAFSVVIPIFPMSSATLGISESIIAKEASRKNTWSS